MDGAVDGRVEGVVDGTVSGWAWRSGQVAPVTVEVRIDGRVVGTAEASESRSSLRRAGVGRGRHGFALRLPEDLGAGTHGLRVLVRPGGEELRPAVGFAVRAGSATWTEVGFELSRDDAPPSFAALPRPRERPRPASDDADEVGVVESLVDRRLTGWVAEDFADADLVLLHDDREVGRGKAEPGRRDLPDGRAGFRLRVPRALCDGVERRLELRVDGRPLAVAAGALRTVPSGEWSGACLRLAQLDVAAVGAPPVVEGRDGYLFEDWEHPGDAGWAEPLDAGAAAAIVERLVAWGAALDVAGIPSLVTLLPARERLLHDRLPGDRAAPAVGTVRAVATALRRTATADWLDLTDVVGRIGEDEAIPVVKRTDDELTSVAAFHVARMLMRALGQRAVGLGALPHGTPPLEPAPSYRGELAGRARLCVSSGRRLFVEPGDVAAASFGERLDGLHDRLRAALPAPLGAFSRLGGAARATERADAAGRLVVVGSRPDRELMGWLAESVGRLVVVDRVDPPVEPIEMQAPDAVLIVLREDRLRDLVP